MQRNNFKKLYEQLLKEHNKTLELVNTLTLENEALKDPGSFIKLKNNTLNEPQEDSPYSMFVKEISYQTEKEESKNIWENSDFKELVKLQANNAGIVGEKFIQNICEKICLSSTIDGTKTKKTGGDGIIKDKIIEIKTAHRGNGSPSFQHELGEKPWLSDYMIFVDVEPSSIYLTVFKNFTESHYKNGGKCAPMFPTKKITQRKGIGAFKLDTSININEQSVKRGDAIKITRNTTFRDLKKYINKIIN